MKRHEKALVSNEIGLKFTQTAEGHLYGSTFLFGMLFTLFNRHRRSLLRTLILQASPSATSPAGQSVCHNSHQSDVSRALSSIPNPVFLQSPELNFRKASTSMKDEVTLEIEKARELFLSHPKCSVCCAMKMFKFALLSSRLGSYEENIVAEFIVQRLSRMVTARAIF